MRTNGLVGALLIAILSVGSGQAADQTLPTHLPSTGDVVPIQFVNEQPASESYTASESYYDGVDWRETLIGSPCGRHIYANTEFMALHMKALTGGRITASFSDTTAPGVATSAFNELSGLSDWSYAPRVSLGAHLTDKWGVRGRYFRITDTDTHTPDRNAAIPTVGQNFATIFTVDTAEAWAGDVEGVRTDEIGQWKFETFVGGRHANYRSVSDFLAFGVFTTGNFVNLTLQNGSGFDGGGVTYGSMIRRRIGDSNVHTFIGARGSHLDGKSSSFGRSDGTVASSPSAPLVGAATVSRNGAKATMTIFELQGGLDFEYQLQNLPATAFLRVAYEYQNWDLEGPPTGGAGFGGTIDELTTNSFASADLGDMFLQGVTISTGLTW